MLRHDDAPVPGEACAGDAAGLLQAIAAVVDPALRAAVPAERVVEVLICAAAAVISADPSAVRGAAALQAAGEALRRETVRLRAHRLHADPAYRDAALALLP